MPPRKRQATATPKRAAEPASSGRRRSQRIGSSSKKSQYFESDSESQSEDEPATKRAKATASATYSGRRGPKPESDESGDDYEAPGEDEDDEEEDEDAAEGEDSEDDDEGKTRSRPSHGGSRGRPGAKAAKGARGRGRAAAEDDDQGDEDEEDEDGEPHVTFIPHKKLRDSNGIEYAPEKLHPNTMLFLADLKANNKRSWLKTNDREYRRAWDDWTSFVDSVTSTIAGEDDTIPELPARDLVFRIYRDIRFSKDQTPYKAHFSAAWSRTGRKGPYACYYVHCEPGQSIVGGGLWHPEADALQRLRASIDERPRRWRRCLTDERFRKAFLPKSKAGDEKSILKAFADRNAAEALKTKPKGFDADHRDIALLKLRNFTVGKPIPDELFTSDDAQEQLAEIVGAMVGFITHLNAIVMPDDPDADDDSEEDDDGGGSESS